MFDNIGGKIKVLAEVLFWFEAVVEVICGIVLMALSGYLGAGMLLVGFLIMLLGPLFAWVSSLFTYGFGELIDKTCVIAQNTYSGERKSEAQPKIDDERIRKIEGLRSQGLITEEEYQQAISKEQ